MRRTPTRDSSVGVRHSKCASDFKQGPQKFDRSNVGLTDAARVHDELLAVMPENARHDADICPFCTEKAEQEKPHASVPSGDSPSGAVTNQPPQMEGGTPDMSTATPEMISRETHEALLEKALKDATSTTEAALERKSTEASELAAKVEGFETKISELETDNAELNKKLDDAQVQLKAAQDENAALKADVTAKEEAALKSELAAKRAEQVENLGLFGKEYISEKASKWADIAEDEWTERLDEWKNFKPATPGTTATDTASAMSGTSEDLATEPPADAASEIKPNHRRAALGLTS